MDAEDRLDEDFMFYLSVAERNWKNLKTEKDKKLGQEWLYKLTALQQTKAGKRVRNVYLSQLALAIGDGELSGPFVWWPPDGSLPAPSQVFGPPQPSIEVPREFTKIDISEDLTTRYTSKDGRTYVATKSLGKDHGAYTYIGISLADTEPLWIGGDTRTGPGGGFERHFVKPQTLYSKPRPRPPRKVFTMEQGGGSGDSPKDTRSFTDYLTKAKNAQMSGTHGKDFQPSIQRLKKAARQPAEKGAAIPVQPPPRPMDGPDVKSPLEKKEAEKEKEASSAQPLPNLLEDLDIVLPSSEEVDKERIDSQMDVSDFYARMITNLDDSLSGRDDLNEYNQEKLDEILQKYAGENTEMEKLEALNRTKEVLIKKLNRVRDEESRVCDSIKALEIMRSPSITDAEESVIEIWEEACKLHDIKNLQLLEEVYNPTVQERVADMMTHLKLRAVHDRSKHMRLQAAAAREDFILQSENLHEKTKAAEDLIDRIQEVLDQVASLKTAAPRENSYFVERRKLVDQLQADVEQLTNMYSVEYDACRSLEREIFNRADEKVFSDPEFSRLSIENQKLRSDITQLKTRLQSLLKIEK